MPDDFDALWDAIPAEAPAEAPASAPKSASSDFDALWDAIPADSPPDTRGVPPRKATGFSPEDHAEAEYAWKAFTGPRASSAENDRARDILKRAGYTPPRVTSRYEKVDPKSLPGTAEIALGLSEGRARSLRKEGEEPGVVSKIASPPLRAMEGSGRAIGTVVGGIGAAARAPFSGSELNKASWDEVKRGFKDAGAAFADTERSDRFLTAPDIIAPPSVTKDIPEELVAGPRFLAGAADLGAQMTALEPVGEGLGRGVLAGVRKGAQKVRQIREAGVLDKIRPAVEDALEGMEQTRATNAKEAALDRLHDEAMAEARGRASREPGGEQLSRDLELREALEKEERDKWRRLADADAARTGPAERRADYLRRFGQGLQTRVPDVPPPMPDIPDPSIGGRVIVGGVGDARIGAVRKLPGGKVAYRADFKDGTFRWSDDVARSAPTDSDKVAAEAMGLRTVEDPVPAPGKPNPNPPIAGLGLGAIAGLPGSVKAQGVSAGIGAGLGVATAPEGDTTVDMPGVQLPFGLPEVKIPNISVPTAGLMGAAGGLLGAGATRAALRAAKMPGGLLRKTGAALNVVEEGKRFGDKVLSLLPKGAEKGWNLLPAAARQNIENIVATTGELAHPVVAQAVDDALANTSRTMGYEHSVRKEMQIRLSEMGVRPGSTRERDVYLYMDGTHAAPAWLTGDARRAVDSSKGYIQDLLSRAEASRATSGATRDEFRPGWLTREFRTTVPDAKPKGILKRTSAISETSYKQNAEGLVITASVDDVNDALARIAPGFKPFREATQEGASTLIKIGKGPEAARITDALEAKFGSDVSERIREMGLPERLARAEKMSPVERFHASVEALEARVTAAELLGDINRGVGSPTPLPGYAQIPDDGAYGLLRGQYVPEPVARFVTQKVGSLGELAQAMNGVRAAMQEAYISTPRGVFQNLWTNMLQYSTFTDVHPFLNVDGLPRWVAGAKDMIQFRRTGKMSPMLKAFIDAGGDLRGITDDVVDELDKLSIGLGALQRETNITKKAKGITQLFGGSPHFKTGMGLGVDTAVNAAAGAVHGAIKGGLRGEGVVAGAVEGAAHMAGMTPVARTSRALFSAMDPWYQLTAFGKQYDLALSEGMSAAEASRRAMKEVRKYAQEFRPQMLPEKFDIATGRKAIMNARGEPMTGVQQGIKHMAPSFLSFPYNQARIFARGFKEKPLSAMMALMQGKWVRRGAIAEMVRRGVWGQDEADKFDHQNPDKMPILTGEGKERKVVLWDTSRQWPGAEVLSEAFGGPSWMPGGVPIGIIPGAIVKGTVSASAARSGEADARDPTSGFNLIDPSEAQNPGAAGFRGLEQGFGGPLSPQGSYRQQADRMMQGKEDLGGVKKTVGQLVANLLFAVRLEDYQKDAGDKRATGLFKIKKNKAKRAKYREKNAPGATDADKQKARDTYQTTKEKLRTEREKAMEPPRR